MYLFDISYMRMSAVGMHTWYVVTFLQLTGHTLLMFGFDVRTVKEVVDLEKKLQDVCTEWFRTGGVAVKLWEIIQQCCMKLEECAANESKAYGEHHQYDINILKRWKLLILTADLSYRPRLPVLLVGYWVGELKICCVLMFYKQVFTAQKAGYPKSNDSTYLTHFHKNSN